MHRSVLCFFLTVATLFSYAGRISGKVTNDKGEALPYASISVLGSSKGVHTNSTGKYSLDLSPGEYTLICQYVNHKKEEQKITVGEGEVLVDFTLSIQQLVLSEVVVKKGEDPAYEIIRQAIKKRAYYNHEVDEFSVEVYIKGLLRSRGIPSKVFGKKVERDANDGLDSVGNGILFLSESITKVSYQKPDKIKFDVISSGQSGGGFGLSFPFFINFYQNNVSVFDNALNPRGFISPIADGALGYYKYKYEGSFFEDDKMVNTIRVIPRRKNSPLFSGTIQIIEDEWRIHSLDLQTTNEYSLELIDTLRISQIHASVEADIWKTKNQVVGVAIKKFGFDFVGNFLNVYSNYDLAPTFTKKTFGRTLMKYDTAFNKKDSSYWNAVRPVALEPDEKKDFIVKDSISKAQRDSFFTRRNLDSLRDAQRPVTFDNIALLGADYRTYGQKINIAYHLNPLIPQIEYNTVEGVSINLEQRFTLVPQNGKYRYIINWNSRYGISNTHLNSYADFIIKKRKENFRNRYLQLSGGKRISQFNHDNPISPLANAAYTLLAGKNYMKLYENWFGRIEYNNRFESGFRLNIHATYEDRIPVENSIGYSISKSDRGKMLPNHPWELADIPFVRHQALVTGFTVTWQPGQHYIEFPDEKVPIGSKAPTFELGYDIGLKNVMGSDVNFDKWILSMYDNMNFKMGGEFRYRISIGGFFNNSQVEIPDMKHFNGNQTFYNNKYLNSFQLAPYYMYSNTEHFYTMAHAEHHFNGLLTNKIPLFNELKWNLVGGVNAFYVNSTNYYVEAFAGIENIGKLFRIDFVNAYQPALGNQFGVRVGMGGLLGGKMSGLAAEME